MKQFQRVSFNLASIVFILPFGLLVSILQTIIFALRGLIDAEVGLLAWVFGVEVEIVDRFEEEDGSGKE